MSSQNGNERPTDSSITLNKTGNLIYIPKIAATHENKP